MRVDSHQHFWKYNPIQHSWINDTMSVLRNDFLPSDLKPILSANNIQACIAVEANPSENETEFLLHCARENNFVKGVVGWVDLQSNRVEERLLHFSQYKNLKGIRHLLQEEGPDFMLGTAFQNGISKLKEYNLSYDVLIFPHQLKEATELVSKFPDQPFVLDHIAKPYIKNKEIIGWQKDIELLAQNKNLCCKVSGMVTEANWNSWSIDDFIPYLDVVFECFGTDRIMFGSDWPVCKLAGEYAQVLQIIEKYIHKFSLAEQEGIMGGNAISFYNLDV